MSGILLFLFGIFAYLIGYYLLGYKSFSVTTCFFTIPGMLLIMYGLLIKETHKNYAINTTRARCYIFESGTFLYGLCISIIVFFLPLRLVAIGLFMVPILISLAILLPLLLTGRSRLKYKRI